MNYPYSKSIFLFLIIIIVNNFYDKAYSQCPGGVIPGNLAYDTTVSTGSGNYNTQFSFPKFDAQMGMVTCVKVCLTITGYVSMFLENNVNSPATYNIDYARNDTLTGPGLNPDLVNQVSVHYGPYNLAASDGVPFSGPDFISIGPDTILNSVTICRTITDLSEISQFYGPDSVTYFYSIRASAIVTGSGDYLFSVSTQGSVRYHLEYCYCPGIILPMNIQKFTVKKINSDQAELEWRASENKNFEDYYYEAQMSRNGYNFSTIGTIPMSAGDANLVYKFLYTSLYNEKGRYFFRIKQIFSKGNYYLSNIKYVDLEASSISEINIYPNPSNGLVGIKFANIPAGKYYLQILNVNGQLLWKKEIDDPGNSYRQFSSSLLTGVYWLRLTDVTNQRYYTNKLLIK